MTEPTFTMRAPCRFGCETTEGWIRTSNGQDCVYCLKCNRHQYNAPKTETGRSPRSVSRDRIGLKPGQRARILLFSNGRCELCGRRGDDANLHVGHLLSVKDGELQGITEAELNVDENLCAMCDECNLGLSEETVPLKFAVMILRARMKRKGLA